MDPLASLGHVAAYTYVMAESESTTCIEKNMWLHHRSRTRLCPFIFEIETQFAIVLVFGSQMGS